MGSIEKDFPTDTINKIAWSESNSRKPIYHMHKWFARRVGSTFRAIILSAFLDGDPMDYYYENVQLLTEQGTAPVVLDPFMGGGTTIVEGNRLGCKMIGIDINPLAWFITKKQLEVVPVEQVEREYQRIKAVVEKKILSYYETNCNKMHKAHVMYAFWVRHVSCEKCGELVPLYRSFRIADLGNSSIVYYCPDCHKIVTIVNENHECECGRDLAGRMATNKSYECPQCHYHGEITKAWLSVDHPPEEQLFAIEYFCKECGRGYKTPDVEDFTNFERAIQEFAIRREELIGSIIPEQKIPWAEMATMRPRCRVYKYYHQLFNQRQLISLAMILQEILNIKDKKVQEFFLITFSDSLNANNMFCVYNAKARKLEPLFGGHYYSPPAMPVENNVWGAEIGRGSFARYFRKGIRALQYQLHPYEIGLKKSSLGPRGKIFIEKGKIAASFAQTYNDLLERKNTLLRCSTAENLSFLPDCCVDAVVTDPPYYDNVMYSELSNFFYVWLHNILRNDYPDIFGRLYSSRKEEVLVNAKVGKDSDFFIETMKRVFKELHRVLKQKGNMIFLYQHREAKAWTAILRALLQSGFYVSAAYPTHGETPSGVRAHGNHYNSILVCRKRDTLNIANHKCSKIRENIADAVGKVIQQHSGLSFEDIFVIAMGKALQICSQNYAAIGNLVDSTMSSGLPIDEIGYIVSESLLAYK